MGESSLPLHISRTRVMVRKQTTAPVVPVRRDFLVFDRLPGFIESYLIKGDIERHSVATLTNRRYRLGRLVWLGCKQNWKQVGYLELQRFFQYLNHGHEQGVGRWDNPQETQGLKPGSVKSFHASIRSFFAWLVKDGELDASPLEKIEPPVDRPDQVVPFTEAQMSAILGASKKTLNPLRDEAILYVLLDCGLRVSELCALCLNDIDFGTGQVLVREGKGGKSRAVPFGRNAKRALWQYCQAERRLADPTEALFLSDRGSDAGANALTRRGIQLLIERLGRRAKLPATLRVSPHTFRHTFAVMMLRNGANIFALKAALGHTQMSMVNRYLALSQADLVAAHRLSSPADRLKDSKGGR